MLDFGLFKYVISCLQFAPVVQYFMWTNLVGFVMFWKHFNSKYMELQ